jgi:hypothetical protein
MQINDRSDQAQARTQPLGALACVRAITLDQRFAFDLKTGILHSDCGLATAGSDLSLRNGWG